MPTTTITRKQLLRYLDKIEAGDPVPEQRFLLGLRHFDLAEEALLRQAIRCPQRGSNVIYSNVDIALITAWKAELQPGETTYARVNRALDGSSHSVNVSGAMLTMWNRHLSHPQIVVATSEDTIMPPGIVLGRRALIVENLENFLHLESTIALLPSCQLTEEWQDADVIYGAGNSVTNHLFTPFLQGYDVIGCLFDADLGGIRMFDTLYQRQQLPTLHFITPHDLPERLRASTRRISASDKVKLSTYMQRTPPIIHAAALIRETVVVK